MTHSPDPRHQVHCIENFNLIIVNFCTKLFCNLNATNQTFSFLEMDLISYQLIEALL